VTLCSKPSPHQRIRQSSLARIPVCVLLAYGLSLSLVNPVLAQSYPDNPTRQSPEQNSSPYFMPDLVPVENRFWPADSAPLSSPMTLADRVSRLEKLLMGIPQTGDLMARQWHLLNALAHQDQNAHPSSGQTTSPPIANTLAPLEGFSKAFNTLEPKKLENKQSDIQTPSIKNHVSTMNSAPPSGPLASEKASLQSQLEALEKAMFDKTYMRDSTTKRLTRLEKARFGYKEDSFPVASRLRQLEASILPDVQPQYTAKLASPVPLQFNNHTPLQGEGLGLPQSGWSNTPKRGGNNTLGEVGRSLLNLGTLAGLGYLLHQGNGLYSPGLYGNNFYGMAPVTPYAGGFAQSTTPFIPGISAMRIPPVGLPYALPQQGIGAGIGVGTFGSAYGTLPLNGRFGGLMIQSNPVPPGFFIPQPHSPGSAGY
jgi:hypothetical protein